MKGYTERTDASSVYPFCPASNLWNSTGKHGTAAAEYQFPLDSAAFSFYTKTQLQNIVSKQRFYTLP